MPLMDTDSPLSLSDALEEQGLDFGVRSGYTGTSSTAPKLIRASLWSDPGSGAQRSLKSSAQADGAGPQSGLLSVRVRYYRGDASGPFEEIVNLSGTSAVAMAETNLRFVESIEGLTVGSNAVAVGNVDLMSAVNGSGSVLARINAGENRTFFAHHFVPSGKKLSLLSVSVGIKGAVSGGRLLTRFQNPMISNSTELDVGDTPRAVGNGVHVIVPYQAPIVLNGPGLLTLWAHPDVATAATWYASLSFFDR